MQAHAFGESRCFRGVAWAHEMRAWINLTTGDYHGVVAAARNGT
jgi:hypothetical protein